MIYDDSRSFHPLNSLAIVASRQYFLVDTLSGVPAHNARQALVRIPMAGEELDHGLGRVSYLSKRKHSRLAKLKKKIYIYNNK